MMLKQLPLGSQINMKQTTCNLPLDNVTIRNNYSSTGCHINPYIILGMSHYHQV
jgi:hypothetical protein